METANEAEKRIYMQRLKAATHHTVGQVCDELREEDGTMFSRQFMASVTEATYKYSQRLVKDLVLFANHAKRTTITPDDLKLAFHKSPTLYLYMQQMTEDLENEAQQKKAAKPKKKARTTAKPRTSSAASEHGDM